MSFPTSIVPKSLLKNKRIKFSKATYEMFDAAVIDLHPMCPICKQRIYRDYNIGHIISVYHGGKNDDDNLVALHRHCNVGTDDLTEIINNLSEDEKRQILMFKVRL